MTTCPPGDPTVIGVGVPGVTGTQLNVTGLAAEPLTVGDGPPALPAFPRPPPPAPPAAPWVGPPSLPAPPPPPARNIFELTVKPGRGFLGVRNPPALDRFGPLYGGPGANPCPLITTGLDPGASICGPGGVAGVTKKQLLFKEKILGPVALPEPPAYARAFAASVGLLGGKGELGKSVVLNTLPAEEFPGLVGFCTV